MFICVYVAIGQKPQLLQVVNVLQEAMDYTLLWLLPKLMIRRHCNGSSTGATLGGILHVYQKGKTM